MIPFALAVHGRTHKRVVMVVSAQSGKTETFLDIIGERLDTAPVPIIYVGPSKQFLREQFEPRITDLLTSTCLKSRLGTAKRMTQTRKFVNGVPLRLAHGGSSTALKSDPFGLAFTDEADEMMKNLRGQGSPVELVDARGDTYADFVHAITSTPGEGLAEVERDPDSGLEFWADSEPDQVRSITWKLWLTGTRHHWAWPCPHCGEYFIPRFECLRWEKPKDADGRELKSTANMARQTAYLQCPQGCAERIYDEHKEEMNRRGVYVAPGQHITPDGTVLGPEPDAWTISFWVSGLASPFVSWGERAARYIEAVRSGDSQKVQTVKNQGFGELFSHGSGVVPEWREVKKCASDAYRAGQVPKGVRTLLMTVDVQKDRLPYVVRGWGRGGRSWMVEAGELIGNTEGEEVWNKLATVVTSTWDGIPLKMVLVDSGFRPGKPFTVPEHRVYSFARRFPSLVRASKGSSAPMRKPVAVSKIDVKIDGTLYKKGLELLRLDTDHFKTFVHAKVRWSHDADGAWHLPADVTEDYCRQIVSEARIIAPTGKVKWVRRSRQNHFLDCEAMQLAGSRLLNFEKLRDGPPARRAPAEEAPATPPSPQAPPPPAQRRAPRAGSIWGGQKGSIW